jgi:type IV pilus modification protein PilV
MMATHSSAPRTLKPRRQSGFALIEAMVALLVVSFGLLSIASFQYTLSRSSDTAKQRTEATRLAQKELDRLRSFSQRQSDFNLTDGRYTYVDDVVSTTSTQTITGLTTNATYNLERAVVTPTVDRFRWVNVVVWWNDRTGDRQEVRLASAISDGDASNLGVLGVQRRVSSTLLPRGGNSKIPFPTVNLAGGTSGAFMPPASGNVVFTFDLVTGRVLQRCTGVTTLSNGINLATTAGVSCTDFSIPGYLLSGYVRFKTSTAATAANIDNADTLTDNTLPLLATVLPAQQPLSISGSATGNEPSDRECYSQRQVVARDSNGLLPNLTIEDSTSAIALLTSGYVVDANSPRFISYVCVVTPINSVNTLPLWSGEVTLNPDSSWTLGALATNYRVCRLTSDYNRNGALANGEHPRFYRGVTRALENQNFLVVRGNSSCPTDVASDLSATPPNFIDTNTAPHQPSPQLSFYCTGTDPDCPTGTAFETTPSNPADAIPME